MNKTISQQLAEKTTHFYVPLGIGAHLEAWGVPAAKITAFIVRFARQRLKYPTLF